MCYLHYITHILSQHTTSNFHLEVAKENEGPIEHWD